MSDVTTELIKQAVSEIRKIHQPEVKLCEVCEENAATAVRRPTQSSFDESRETVPTTCKNCAMKDDMNDYVLDLAKCGHARSKYKEYLDCKECVSGRQRNNILTRGEICRKCDQPLNIDNISGGGAGMICRGCTTENANDTNDVKCDDCGVKYKKHTNKSKKSKSASANSRCVTYFQEANATCKFICQNTMVIGGITMRCRRKRYTQRRGNDIICTSKFCGSKNKCLNLS